MRGGAQPGRAGMELWDDPLCARALLSLCMCESFEVFGIPQGLTRETEVEYRCFHRGRHEGCTNERCAMRRRAAGGAPCLPLATWLPKDRVGINIYVDDGLRTLIGIRGRVMLASQHVMQGHQMPPGTMVLAHFVLDRVVGGEPEPRVLVYDIVRHSGRSVEGLPPASRYKLLLGIFKSRKELTTLQWLGDESSAFKNQSWFTSELPHDIECLVTVGCDPWLLSRVMRVDVGKGSLQWGVLF